MTKLLALNLLAALVATVGCTASDTAPEARVVRLTGSAPSDCVNVQEFCIQTYPVQCFIYCDDEPEVCEPVACPAIYPTPPECENTCGESELIDCTTSVEFSDAAGETLIGCVEPGEPGEPEAPQDHCGYFCNGLYPSTCEWTCAGEGCTVSIDAEGNETTDCGDTSGCTVTIDAEGNETTDCGDTSGCTVTIDAEGNETEHCPPGVSPGNPGGADPEPPSVEPQPAPAS